MLLTYKSFFEAKAQIDDILAIDYYFAKEIIDALAIEHDEALCFHFLVVLNKSLREGHSCLPLQAVAGTQCTYSTPPTENDNELGYSFPNLTELTTYVEQLDISPEQLKPIVYWQGNVYLRRYFQFEQDLKANIMAKLSIKPSASHSQINAILMQLFPEHYQGNESDIDWQLVAVANALNKKFAVIAGGPGTGKTYTVTKLLAAKLMMEQSLSVGTNDSNLLNIALVAPTGKAAQRLSESINNAVSGFKGSIDDAILDQIPLTAQTIHRLLGVIHNQPNFKHNEHNLLPYDLLLIDEVSMVDLPLMLRLMKSLKSDCTIILLGDADQLPSVSTGSVLADIAPRPLPQYSTDNNAYLVDVTPYEKQQLLNQAKPESYSLDYLSFLKKSRRFDGEGGIGLLAAAVIAGKVDESWQLLQTENNEQLTYVESATAGWLLPLIQQYYVPIAKSSCLEQAFQRLTKFRVLCASRVGDLGVESLNSFIVKQVQATLGNKVAQISYGLSSQTINHNNLFHGQPIMITENNYQSGLFNGDIGLVWKTDEGSLAVYFEDTVAIDNDKPKFRKYIPSRLPKYESVYAMTIHKTQGSEFEHVAMVLPKQGALGETNKLLSRELLYTAITRAKQRLTISSDYCTWQEGVSRKVKRYSGLTLK
ncbi:exodeoxyribonuclease V subunit alpha [Colwellia sp. RSH04]|uniref:exodeoxyribonuclease V subunit alpha n=1 Tax=Colwellia sp. RSH04 TaxID=2305464 RepID=UPI000E5735BC|nr:exodeoxyribonuclease V subunit alpha [Colwellia sp. RSH04]RHW77171.1 exodeoxyribonuclease V subunit alpha [Colwellia sp. RSH04]